MDTIANQIVHDVKIAAEMALSAAIIGLEATAFFGILYYVTS